MTIDIDHETKLQLEALRATTLATGRHDHADAALSRFALVARCRSCLPRDPADFLRKDEYVLGLCERATMGDQQAADELAEIESSGMLHH